MQTEYYILAILVITLLIFFAIAGVLTIIQRQKLKTKAKEYAKEALVFHEKLEQLSAPSHFFTDEEALQLKQEFSPLVNAVKKLYKSSLITHKYLNDLGLKEFLEERMLVNHIQVKNNQKFRSQNS